MTIIALMSFKARKSNVYNSLTDYVQMDRHLQNMNNFLFHNVSCFLTGLSLKHQPAGRGSRNVFPQMPMKIMTVNLWATLKDVVCNVLVTWHQHMCCVDETFCKINNLWLQMIENCNVSNSVCYLKIWQVNVCFRGFIR